MDDEFRANQTVDYIYESNIVMEKTGYALLAIVVIVWIGIVVGGLVLAFPYGLIGLVGIVGIGFLLIKVISDRLNNKEDDHYSDNVDK